MKSIMIFYLLLIFTFSVPHVSSYSSHKARLHSLLGNSFNSRFNSLTPAWQHDKDASLLVPEQQTRSNERTNHLQTRENWDSGEGYYFLWANKNRRPVEYLTGRKRDANKATIPVRASRINGGLWRSGLVG